VQQKRVAEELRDYLDVMEGVKCMIYGRPSKVTGDKAGLYFTYAPKSLKESASLTEDRKIQYEIADDEHGEQL
jgi:hypothetical protein